MYLRKLNFGFREKLMKKRIESSFCGYRVYDCLFSRFREKLMKKRIESCANSGLRRNHD